MHMYTCRRVANPDFSADLVGTGPSDTAAGATLDAYMVNHDRAQRPSPLPGIP